MYRVTCSYGTKKVCWTMRTALEWLAAAGPDAAISDRITGRVMRSRIQTRAY